MYRKYNHMLNSYKNAATESKEEHTQNTYINSVEKTYEKQVSIILKGKAAKETLSRPEVHSSVAVASATVLLLLLLLRLQCWVLCYIKLVQEFGRKSEAKKYDPSLLNHNSRVDRED